MFDILPPEYKSLAVRTNVQYSFVPSKFPLDSTSNLEFQSTPLRFHGHRQVQQHRARHGLGGLGDDSCGATAVRGVEDQDVPHGKLGFGPDVYLLLMLDYQALEEPCHRATSPSSPPFRHRVLGAPPRVRAVVPSADAPSNRSTLIRFLPELPSPRTPCTRKALV